jgi:hypothetical protein
MEAPTNFNGEGSDHLLTHYLTTLPTKLNGESPLSLMGKVPDYPLPLTLMGASTNFSGEGSDHLPDYPSH